MVVALRVVHPAHEAAYRIMVERADRTTRIDALAPDRSHLIGAPVPRWSEEALEQGELSRQAERAEVTIADRIEAYRAAWALPMPKVKVRRP